MRKLFQSLARRMLPSANISEADVHSSVFTKYPFLKTIHLPALDLGAFRKENFPVRIDLLNKEYEY